MPDIADAFPNDGPGYRWAVARGADRYHSWLWSPALCAEYEATWGHRPWMRDFYRACPCHKYVQPVPDWPARDKRGNAWDDVTEAQIEAWQAGDPLRNWTRPRVAKCLTWLEQEFGR